MEKILDILTIDDSDNLGYHIITSLQVISIIIDNQSQCCENYGVIVSEDSPSEYIGSEFLGINVIEKDLNKVQIDIEESINSKYHNELGGVLFVNVNTSLGDLQFTIYNSHNGYYGHAVRVIGGKVNFSATL
jgi:hypothetical protein